MRPADARALGHLIAEHRGAPWSVAAQRPRRGAWFDLSRLSGLIAVDRTSGVAHLRAATRWAEAEAAVSAQGATLGPIPGWLHDVRIMDSFAFNDRLRASPRYGQLIDASLAIRAVLPNGRLTRSTVTPRRATGPDLARAVVGAGHRAGVVTDVHLRVWARPVEVGDFARGYRSWRAGVEGALAVLAAGVKPAWWRLARVDKALTLVGQLHAENGDALAAQARRFDAACGGEPLAGDHVATLYSQVFAGPLEPRRVAEVCAPSAVADALRGRRGAELWDLRPEGVSVLLPGARKAPFDRRWRALADTFFAALEGSP